VIEAIDGESMTAAEDLERAWSPGSGLTLTVRRARTRLKVPLREQLPVSTRPDDDFGLTWIPDDGVVVEAVRESSPAFRAGVRPGDRVTTIDGRAPRDRAEVRRLLAARRAGPVFLDVVRGPRRFGALLP
jgi:S1-C subfamily serine protease